MWNDYILANYKQAGGKVTTKMFERNLSNFITKNYPAQIRTLQETYVADANVREDIYEQLNETLIF